MRMLKLKWVSALVGIAGIALMGWYFWSVREPSYTVLLWEDTNADITFRVTETPGAIAHTFTRLHVTRDGQTESEQLDDDAYFGTASLVRWEDWLLVLNDDFVMGGYQYSTGTLYGEYDWEKLPLTIRSQAGEIVVRKRIRGRGAKPATFPSIHEPTTFPSSIGPNAHPAKT